MQLIVSQPYFLFFKTAMVSRCQVCIS